VAALTVVINHLMFMFLPFAVNGSGFGYGRLQHLIHDTPFYLIVSGDFAVAIFFVLSGIVLSAKFFRTRDETVVAASAVKRYFRLAIPTLGSVSIAYLLLKLGWMYNQPAGALTSEWWKNFWQFGPSLKDALYQGTYGAFFTENNTYNPVLWTMKLEFLGSFLVFATLLLFGRLHNRWIAYGLLAAFFATSYFLAFVLGVAICDYYFNGDGRIQRLLQRGWWVPVLAVSLLLGSFPVTNTHGTIFAAIPPHAYIVAFIHIVAAFGTICAVMSVPVLQWALERRPVQLLGRISYPLYLLHFLVLGSYTSYLFVTLAGQFGLKWAIVGSVPPTLVILFISSYLYARWVDEPAIRLSGQVYRRLFRTRRVAPAPEPVPVQAG
jgi:peptidoglycan/LPS O-acetylase OafA/YrhL